MFFTKKDKQKIADMQVRSDLRFENIHERVGNEVSKLDKKIEETSKKIVFDINELLVNKFRSLELFKQGEEVLGNNAFSFAIIQELVKRAFSKEEKTLYAWSQELTKKERELKVLALDINAKKAIGYITVEQVKNELSKLEDDYNIFTRQTTSENDSHDLKAKQIKHTIDFIKVWLKIS